MALPSSTSAEYSVVVHCTILRSAQCAYWALYYNLNTAQCTILCMLLNLPYCGTLLSTNQCGGEIKSWNDAEQVPCVKSVADSTHWFPKNMTISNYFPSTRSLLAHRSFWHQWMEDGEPVGFFVTEQEELSYFSFGWRWYCDNFI